MATRVDDDRSVGQLLGDVTRELQALVRKELELARAETKEELQRAGAAGKRFGVAALAGYLAVVMLSFAAAWALTALMPTGWAFFAVGVVLGGVAVWAEAFLAGFCAAFLAAITYTRLREVIYMTYMVTYVTSQTEII